MNFNLNGTETLVEYIYPWLPSRCSNCTKWGHLEKACLAPRKIPEAQTNTEVEEGEIVVIPSEVVNVEEQNISQEEEAPAVVQPIQSDVATSVSTEVVIANLSDDKTEENTMLREDEMIALKEMEWSEVSPGKSSRSPRNTPDIEQLMTTSRFSVLSQTEEEGEEMEENGRVESVEEAESVLEDAMLTTTQKVREQNVVIMRQSLPRDSKDKHKFLSDLNAQKAKEAPSASSKKSTRKHH